MLSETKEKTTKVPPHQAMGPSESEVVFEKAPMWRPMSELVVSQLLDTTGRQVIFCGSVSQNQQISVNLGAP